MKANMRQEKLSPNRAYNFSDEEAAQMIIRADEEQHENVNKDYDVEDESGEDVEDE